MHGCLETGLFSTRSTPFFWRRLIRVSCQIKWLTCISICNPSLISPNNSTKPGPGTLDKSRMIYLLDGIRLLCNAPLSLFDVDKKRARDTDDMLPNTNYLLFLKVYLELDNWHLGSGGLEDRWVTATGRSI